ncbi:hypothetical protein LMG28690_01172 [Paraburkholderia caffeinilytica]|nr:hypothetical protein LMG28690_01172 [Paraburkholderia caffeinilytica]
MNGIEDAAAGRPPATASAVSFNAGYHSAYAPINATLKGGVIRVGRAQKMRQHTFAAPVLAGQGRAASLPPTAPCLVLRSRVAGTDHIYINGDVEPPHHET